ncbi:bifunctional salicylyl-CoA 5-hydroxylase/oxidoreductase [Streptacidiphilus rugosus]|uniref:bifunctional salicylyl-CoA 5-hydroxylase/oxidoreductase n=1 Tax=Streptacidiphilus rugosus TaxID=405783 RepID=UPI00068CAD53|nr:bifunctional salicylyl-CoA 5-hydroxylase/oxidoreductase [Streptacidiphilus rugosus]
MCSELTREAALRIAVIGGGPGGLYFAALAKRQDPGHEVTVWERNAAGDTFGFGVVLSDETLGGIEEADPELYTELAAGFARWDDIDVHLPDGRVFTSGGHGFAATSRRRLLDTLQARCRALGVDLRFRTEAPPAAELARTHDLVVAADGVRSRTRTAGAEVYRPTLDTRRCRYIWLGTDLVFDAFQFHVLRTEHGVMQLHGYPYSADGSTVIVEMREDVWRRAGLDLLDEQQSIAACEKLFADALGGHALRGNDSRWIAFATVRNAVWHDGTTVLLGDAAHTAHFSIGSGTKLAMEDALALAASLPGAASVSEALTAYETERRPVVESTQRAAQASLEWFENLDQYLEQPGWQFAFNLLTRSRRITYDNLRLRDPGYVAALETEFAGPGAPTGTPPMFTPFRLRGLTLRNRVVVSPMDMYSAEDGLPNDFHLVHLGARALGGAGLVMTEMVCVAPEARITLGCTGLWSDEQQAAWGRIVDFVHGSSGAAIGLQLGHAGRKGATRLMWEGMDDPLDQADAWPVVAPSPLAYRPGLGQVPSELTPARLGELREQFAAAARRGAAAGFDLLELHCAHGYLLSSFLSPLTNHRTDAYGGSLEARLRWPLEVFDAMREVWPEDRPMTVRVSATDWAAGGNEVDDAVAIAAAFTAHGADAIDVSTGQVVSDERPAYGRSYQTPFADAIRNRVRVPVVAVGAVSSWDDVNSLILAGRADLVALGRPHLYDPAWTLHAAAEQEWSGPGVDWPLPYRAGSRRPQTGRKQ